MNSRLLSTKLIVPPPRADLVPRPDLLNMLDDGFNRKLVLISAPPGYGKTSLVSGWLDRIAASSTPSPGIGWLALDEADNDPILFFAYLMSAVQHLAPDLVIQSSSLLNSPQVPAPAGLASSLLYDLENIHAAAFVVLDDYHLIRNPAIHQALALLLDRLPSNLHLVIISREDPPLPLPRLRLRREMVEIREKDLRFSLNEATAFLSQTMHLHLLPEIVQGLLDRTEGWVAGLQMAALALQNEAGKPENQSAEAFITSFHGDDRFVMDYLMDEVFHRQPEDLQNFLLQTAVLDRICAPLACAVLDPPESGTSTWRSCQVLLETMEKMNLFLIPMDHHREWYRYHHLFAELLRYRLKRDAPERLPEYHRRAALWFAQAGSPDEAMQHALSAADTGLAATIVERFGMQMIGAGRIASFIHWAQSIPDSVIFSHPLLCANCGWAYVLAGLPDAAENYVEGGENSLIYSEQGSVLAGQVSTMSQDIRGQLAAIRSYIARRRGNLPAAIDQAQLALSLLPAESRSARCAAALNLGLLYLDRMQYSLAREALLKAIDEAGSSRENDYAAVTALSQLGYICARGGKLREAESYFQRAIHYGEEENKAGSFSPARGIIHGWTVWLHLQRNELALAREQLEIVMRAAEQIGSVETQSRAYIYQAIYEESHGDHVSAAVWLERASESISGGQAPDLLQTEWLVAKVHNLLACSDLSSAAELFEARGIRPADLEPESTSKIPPPVLALRLERYLALAYLLRAQGELSRSTRLLERIASLAEALPDMAIRLEALALLAAIFPRRISYLEQALNLAAPEGYKMVFLRPGGALIQPLLQAIAQGIQPAYAHHLHEQLSEQQRRMALPAKVSPRPAEPGPESTIEQAAPVLSEPLTGREKQVVRLLAAGLSSTEVAGQLVISVSTARSYIKNIYSKLDAHSRAEVVKKAARLGIL